MLTSPTLLTLIAISISMTIIVRLQFFRRLLRHVSDLLHSHQTFVIPHHHDVTPNPLYRKALAYVTSLPSLEDSETVHVFSSARKSNDFYALPGPTKTVVADHFHGAHLQWTIHDSTSLHLRVRRKDRHRVLRPYLQHVELVGDDLESKRKEVKLYYNIAPSCWKSVLFTHPATFDTVAMDEELKVKVKSDLEAFAKGRGYYNRLGKVWKRSYVLYGPIGSGKSAFVAAMAKHLNYDVYDLDLSKIKDGADYDIKSSLLQTSPKSVVLVENFDRYTPEMLSFTEGVFSSCGEERLFVYTTSSEKEEDVKRVRSDVQIYFPLCDFTGFKNLASSYLGLKDHKLYSQVEEGFERGAKLSQDEIGDIMIANRGSPSRAIKNVINALHKSSPSVVVSYESSGVVNSGGFGKEATVREIKKLYGLIKRSGSKKEGVMSVEMAAAAAAAAAANGGSGLEKEGSR